ncbi:MAG: 23S rRNA (adenine(2503)-C(2))-methyltransferase RlmN [Deltaproteobacteria bacterium]|nr:MAG: 23S rRNA (adenine(2503)-C(2))-methyltransferase RlmN [Deltaproteobacteria bacterium]
MQLLGTPFDQLAPALSALGVPEVHASKVFRQVHHFRAPLADTPGLGKHLAPILDLAEPTTVDIVESHRSSDGTERLVFGLADGKQVEGVLIPNPIGDRVTLCLSSQVGCAMACAFCATGTLGLARNLSAAEIVGQVYAADARATASGQRLTHLVFMGMGEPLHNYEAVRDALSVLFDSHGRPMDMRRVTVSTVGLLQKIRRFGEDFGGRVQLALSLHAGTDETRARILPIAKTVSMAELRETLLAHPLPGSRHLMIEYVVLPGVNDAPEELDALAAWMDGIDGIVNLIPFNPFAGASFRSPTTEEVVATLHGLRERGVPAKIRWPRGREAHGACGQLMLAKGASGGA